jgi:enoyl-CoA hydratase/carnithine racemase
MEYRDVRVEVADGIQTITLHRPERLNAFTRRMADELIDAVDRADADDAVRAVIFTGAGRGFCAGADLSSGSDTFDAERKAGEAVEEHRDAGGLVTLRLYDSKKPLIAAVNGPAVGIGVTMTLPMDVRIASTAARFGFVFARRGIVPEACSSWFLPRLVGGLVSRVVAPDALIETTRALAREIADNTSAVSVALSRQLLWKGLGADHPIEAHRLDSKCIHFMGRSADAYEGVQAFLEKRPAKFSMKPSSDMPPFYPWWKERSFR